MKKIFQQIEIKKIQKLVNENETVLFTQGNEIEYIYNKRTGKRYYPKYKLAVAR